MSDQTTEKGEYNYRSMELIGEINGTIGGIESKLSICLASDDSVTPSESVACKDCTLQTRMNKGIENDVDSQLSLICNFRTLYMQKLPPESE